MPVLVMATPVWDNNVTTINTPATYTTGQNFGFQVHWADDIGGVENISNATFETNFTGALVNYTSLTTPAVTNNTNGIFWINFTQTNVPVGTFSIRWFAINVSTDTVVKIENVSDTWTYAVDKGILAGSSSSPTVTYPTSLTATGANTNSGDDDITYGEYCDDIEIATALNGNPSGTLRFGAGTYACKLNTTTTGPFGNWTANASIATSTGTVNKGVLTLSISKNYTSPITYTRAITTQGQGCTFDVGTGSDVTCMLYRGNSTASVTDSSNDTLIPAVGTIAYNYSTTGGANWSSASASNFTLVINKGTLVLSLTGVATVASGGTASVTPSQTNMGVNDVNFTFWRNAISVNFTVGATPPADLSTLLVGTYLYVFNTTGGANWSSTTGVSFTATAIPQQNQGSGGTSPSSSASQSQPQPSATILSLSALSPSNGIDASWFYQSTSGIPNWMIIVGVLVVGFYIYKKKR